ncbi:MAG: M48 family metalloprotease [Gammaproteobacteria bacterium]|nr:M48 family metalloprotease [Gammaproteobacteria bacterium]
MTAIPALKPFMRRGAVLLACLVAPAAQPQTLPALGETSAAVVSSVEETRLGRQFMRSARRQMDFSADPELVEYIRDLGARLVSGVGSAPGEFTFSVVNDPVLNAFAVPGGFISVHSGLIAATASESELASVMAHEIAHITQRHLPRMIARAKERSIPAAAAMVAAILVGGQMGSAALVGANAALAADQLRYSRDFETEADAMGIRILAASGFDATAMPKFFQKLQNQTMLQASEAPEYLRTHPLSVNRIADSESRASGYATASHRSSTDYLMMRAGPALMAGDPLRAAGNFADAGAPNGDEALAARYGEGPGAHGRRSIRRRALDIRRVVRGLSRQPLHRAGARPAGASPW